MALRSVAHHCEAWQRRGEAWQRQALHRKGVAGNSGESKGDAKSGNAMAE
ncbi:MAG: hypothetical protein RSC38_02450 [Oscillospiraceae bacterium]